MSPTTKAYDLCVVGAGPVGGTLACLAARRGFSVALIDKAALPPMEHPAFDGRAYAIAAGSQRLLENAGLWQVLPLPPCPINDIRVTDGEVGCPAAPFFLHFAVADLPGAVAPAFGWMIEARSLRRAINAQVHAEPLIDVWAPAEARIERGQTTASIQLAEGTSFTAKLVVAADGRASALRRSAAIPVTRIGYDQVGLVFAVRHERPHLNTAVEHFLPSGPFAQLPMAASEAGEHVSAIVWTERQERAPAYLSLDDPALAREISRRLGPHLGAVTPVGQRWSYPLSAMHAHRYFDQRLALVGDAAHGVHPIAGQGLNLGFRDIGALVAELESARDRGEDIGGQALLARYQRCRRPDNLAMLGMTDVLDRLFSNRSPVLRLARDLGIAGVHRALPLKRFFMRRAMGA